MAANLQNQQLSATDLQLLQAQLQQQTQQAQQQLQQITQQIQQQQQQQQNATPMAVATQASAAPIQIAPASSPATSLPTASPVATAQVTSQLQALLPQVRNRPWSHSYQIISAVPHIEAKTKWPPFSRQHFQMHCPEWKCMNFDEYFTEVCS